MSRRFMNLWFPVIIAALVVSSIGVGVVLAQGGALSVGTIYAAVSSKNGSVRILNSADDSLARNESLISWKNAAYVAALEARIAELETAVAGLNTRLAAIEPPTISIEAAIQSRYSSSELPRGNMWEPSGALTEDPVGFIVRLSRIHPLPVSFDVTFTDITATYGWGLDYYYRSQAGGGPEEEDYSPTWTIAAGQEYVLIPAWILQDGTVEEDETFSVTICGERSDRRQSDSNDDLGSGWAPVDSRL